MRFAIVFALCLAVLVPASFVLAQSDVADQIVPCGSGGDFCNLCDLVQLAQNLINIGIFITVALSAVTFAVAGLKYMTAGGDTTKAIAARKMFTNVAVGLIIILGAWIGVDTLMKTVTDESRFGPWNDMGCSQTGSSLRF